MVSFFFFADTSQNYFHVLMNRHGRHNIRNGIVSAQTGTVSLHVVKNTTFATEKIRI